MQLEPPKTKLRYLQRGCNLGLDWVLWREGFKAGNKQSFNVDTMEMCLH